MEQNPVVISRTSPLYLGKISLARAEVFREAAIVVNNVEGRPLFDVSIQPIESFVEGLEEYVQGTLGGEFLTEFPANAGKFWRAVRGIEEYNNSPPITA